MMTGNRNRQIQVGLSAVLLSVAGGCTSSQPAHQAAQPDPVLEAAMAAQDQGIVCGYVARVGTRVSRKVCTTAEQRAEMRENGRLFVENIQLRALYSNGF